MSCVTVSIPRPAPEAVLSAFLEPLLDWLKENSSKYIVDDKLLLTKLTVSLSAIRLFLVDAEDEELNKEEVQKWLIKLEETLYDVDDMIDEMATDDAARLIMLAANSQQPTTSMHMPGFIRPRRESSPKQIGETIKSKIYSKVETLEILNGIAIALDLDKVEKRTKGAAEISEEYRRFHSPTSSVDDFIVGREEDTEKIVQILLSDGVISSDGIAVVSIFGVDGFGKSTLAHLAYQRVESEFDARAWICVGCDFDICQIWKSIIVSVTGEMSETNDLSLLERKLEDCLVGKRVLIVLDDVWPQNYDKWNSFLKPLTAGSNGSKIIVTTSWKSVSKIVSNMPAYEVKKLRKEDFWLLASKHAFGDETQSPHPDLLEIGEEITGKWWGSPLAAKALGSLLRFTPSKYWKYLQYWTSKTETLYLSQVLNLSYNHLPAILKRCIAYCSIFPENYEFTKEKLVRLWMAEGFLQQPNGAAQEKDAGENCFLYLLKRHFFQHSFNNNSCFVMHDFVSCIAHYVLKRFCVRLEGATSYNLTERVRHLSYNKGEHDASSTFESIFTAKNLRTVLSVNSLSDYKSYHLSNDVLQNLFVKLPRLRVLSLPFFEMTEMPNALGNLKHLRYLDLSHTALKSLPPSTTSLYNLQTLDLSNCKSLSKLPDDMWKLVNLLHLLISESGAQEMPLGMSGLRKLQTLSNFILSKDGFKIMELTELSTLRGALTISKMESLRLDNGVWTFNLAKLTGIEELELEWSSGNDDPEPDEVLENLVLPMELKRLAIESYSGKRFPRQLVVSSLSKILFLSLRNCKNCLFLPPIGLLTSLEVLEIEGLDGIARLGPEIYEMNSSTKKSFQSLRILMFSRMLNWEEWEILQAEDGGFPSLQELHIINCPNLKGDMPKRLPSLKKLVISECGRLVESLRLPVTSAGCNIKIDGKRVKPRCKDEYVLPVTSVTNDVASTSSMKMTGTPEITGHDNVEAESSDATELESLPHTTKISSIAQEVASQTDLVIADEVDNQATTLDSSPGCLNYCHETELDLPYETEISILPQEDSSETVLASTSHDLETSKTTTLDSSDDDLEVPILLQEVVSQTTLASTSHDVDAESCLHTEVTDESDDEAGPFLSQDEMHYQYACPGMLTVSEISQVGKLPASFHSLRIEGCDNSESLPFKIISRNSSILHLYVIDCGFSLVSFAKGARRTSLKTLHIQNCRKLEFPSTVEIMHQCGQLEHLCIGSSCKSLQSFPLNLFPKLEILCLWGCLNLDSLTIDKRIAPSTVEALESLEIRDCPNLRSFPEGGFSAPKLTSIVISNCNKLQSLPSQIHCLKSLRSLFISKCQELRSIPTEGLPKSLNLLCITSCDNMIPRTEWKLHELDDLTHFEIGGGCTDIESFPVEGLLPESLVELRISGLPYLKCLDQKGLQQLTSLEKLEINCCKGLHRLPEELPSSLSFLSINECPPLKAKLQKKKGKDWSRIADIPTIFVDDVEFH